PEMLLSEHLVAERLVGLRDVERGVARRKETGEPLGQCLVALGVIASEQLDDVINRRPLWPKSVEDTGLGMNFLVTLMLKTMYACDLESEPEIVERLKLPPVIVQRLLQHAQVRQWIEALGSSARPNTTTGMQFALSANGRQRAVEALAQQAYVGPTPVPLSAFQAQVKKQPITRDRIDSQALSEGLSHLVTPDRLLDKLGPAVNSGQSILLHGPPGNGKSSIAAGIGRSFRQLIYVPYCLEVGGQIIKVFDPTVHQAQHSQFAGDGDADGIRTIRQSTMDRRWVCCRRPVVTTGVELAPDMLELKYHREAQCHEAPIHMKACGGVIVVEDFGLQRARSIEILNRWTVPADERSDLLTLKNGDRITFPADALAIFCTSQPLHDVLDSGLLGRIAYRVSVDPPSPHEFVHLLERECAAQNLSMAADISGFVFDGENAANGRHLAWQHPRFIVEHAIASCRYRGIPPQLDRALLTAAIETLSAGIDRGD
ncbi:MAG: hypothetical protein ACE5JZ_00465, partial [Kiloniellales bacterium]